MKKMSLLMALIFLPSLAVTSDTSFSDGAWLQDGVKWVNAPRDINPHLQSGSAAVLYFGKDQTFALIYCTVGREPNKYITISHGDPQNVFLGKWEIKGENILIEYRLVSRTILKIPKEELPGPIQHATMKVSNNILSFDRKTFRPTPGLNERTFHRTPELDKSAAEVVNGLPRSSRKVEGGKANTTDKTEAFIHTTLLNTFTTR
jgi:hypothetical protein